MERVVEVLDVTAEPEEEAGAVEIARGTKEVTKAELAEYAKATGVTLVKLRSIKKKSVLGQLIDKLGAAQIGTALVMESPDMIQDAIKQCDSMMGDYAHEPDVMAQLMKAKVSLIDLLMKAGQTLIKSKKDAGADMPTAAPLNQPFPAGAPVQINLQVNERINSKVEGS